MHEAFSEQLKDMCRDKFGGIPGFARKYHIPVQTVYSELREASASLSSEVLLAFSKEFDLDPYALNQQCIAPCVGSFVNVPLVGSIAAGQPLEMLSTTDWHPIPPDVADMYPKAFLLRVRGESMNRVLPNGCFALVDPCSEVLEQGDPYVVAIDNTDATVKRVRVLNNGIELLPDSNDPTFKPLLFDYSVDKATSIRIVGRVVWFCVPKDWRF